MGTYIFIALIVACLLALALIFLSARRIQKEGITVHTTDREHFVRSVEDVKRRQEQDQAILDMADDAGTAQVNASRLGFGKAVQMSVEAAILRVKESLEARGLQLLGVTDVNETLHDKQLPPFRMMTVVHRELAGRAAEVEPLLGLMAAHAIVRQDLAGEVHIEFSDPSLLANHASDDGLHQMASEFKSSLLQVLQAI